MANEQKEFFRALDLLEKERSKYFYFKEMVPEYKYLLRRKKEIKGFDIPVIALTANAIRGVEEMYLSKGFSDYLSKPIQTEKLLGILKKYIKNEEICEEKSREDMLKEAITALQDFDGERAEEIITSLCRGKQEEELSAILIEMQEFRYDEAEEKLKYILDNNL